MRATNFQAVTLFNEVMGNKVPEHAQFPDDDVITLRKKLIYEEAIEELNEAIEKRDLTGVADAIADGLFVLYGAANDFGLDADMLFSEVARSNMTKLCDSKSSAEYAVERYRAGDGFHGKTEPVNAAYRMCDLPGMEDKFVIFDVDTGKVLKGPSFEEPKLAELVGIMMASETVAL